MHPSPTIGRRLVAGVTTVALAIALGGCGGSAAPTATPAPTPTPTPKPLPVAFKDRINASDFQFEGPVTGTISMTVAGQEYKGTITGSAKAKGKDSAFSWTMTLAGTSQTQESVTVGDFTYARTDNGAWSKSAKSATSSNVSISQLFEKASVFQDKGVETWDGKQLHKLVVDTAGLDPADVLGSDSNIGNPTLEIAFWSTDDGTPAGMTMSVSGTTQVSGQAVPMSMTMEIAMHKLSGVTIEAPAGA